MRQQRHADRGICGHVHREDAHERSCLQTAACVSGRAREHPHGNIHFFHVESWGTCRERIFSLVLNQQLVAGQIDPYF